MIYLKLSLYKMGIATHEAEQVKMKLQSLLPKQVYV